MKIPFLSLIFQKNGRRHFGIRFLFTLSFPYCCSDGRHQQVDPVTNQKSHRVEDQIVDVQAAQQRYQLQQLHQGDGQNAGQQKKEYVVSFLLSKGIVFDVDEVNAMIESEVWELSQSISK